MRRTKWNAIAFLFSGALILAACGTQPGESGESSAPESQDPGSSAAPTDGGTGTGTITMVVDGQITTLSNARRTSRPRRPYQFLGTGLYQYDAALTPIPDLAADLCEVSEDEITWTCTLQDATFHNGDPVTAADVVFTYDIAKSDNCRFNPSICLGPFLDSATAVDEKTVEFTLIEPYAPFATVILPGIAIDSEAVVTAAYEDFVGEAEGADPAAVAAAADALTAATGAEEPDPAACDAALAAGRGCHRRCRRRASESRRLQHRWRGGRRVRPVRLRWRARRSADARSRPHWRPRASTPSRRRTRCSPSTRSRSVPDRGCASRAACSRARA